MSEGFKTVEKAYAEASFIEKKSEFLSYVARVEDETAAKSFIVSVREKHPDATHHCYAYILKDTGIARFSDDGEPSGTAGMPILEVLKREGLCGVCVVVTRYFGGILLGAGGLVRAYAKGAKLGVDAAGTAEFVPHTCFEASVSYGEYEKIVREMPKYGVTNVSTVFEADVKLVMSAENTNFERFAAFLSDYTAGRVKCIVTGSCFGKAGGGEQV